MALKAWLWVLYIFSAIKLGKLEENNTIVWCTVSKAEQSKCSDFIKARKEHKDSAYISRVDVACYQASSKDHCMSLIDEEKADLLTLDPGEIYLAGRYHSLIPIVAERYGSDKEDGYYAVAVIRDSLDVKALADLKGKKACFPGVGQMAGWVMPVSFLIEHGVIEVKDCNNVVKSVAAFFGDSCAPSSLSNKFNPRGDNPLHMCSLCFGRQSTHCSENDRYANFDGAFKCLVDKGEIAFLKHTTVEEMTESENYDGPSKDSFRLLCPQGHISDIDSFQNCNWGYVSAHAVVTTSATSRKSIFQKFLTSLTVKLISNLSRDKKYSGRNLLFQDLTTDLVPLREDRQTFSGYLSNAEIVQQQKLLKCPIPSAKLCVTSDPEMKKCQKMKTAFKAKMLKPDLECIKGFSTMECMQLIKEDAADLVVLDAGDIYHAGQKFNLMPIIAEVYDLDEPAYYAVAVAKTADKITDLLHSKGRRTCHSGIGTAAGWVFPMSFLISSDRMRSYGCDSVHAAAEFFQKSCIPGALSKDYSVGDIQYNTLCDLCHGTSSHFCSKSSQEPFFGTSGALRCLIEGGGDIAFVRHSTIPENTAGKNSEWWSRPLMPDDFQLLCKDGTRAEHDQYANCNLGKVSSNAIVTNKLKPKEFVEAYIDLFMYAQQYYGSKYSEDFSFKLFVSEDDNSNLIFQDATQQLKAVPEKERDYRAYLGHHFLNAVHVIDCTSSSSVIRMSLTSIILLFLLHILFF